MTLVDVTKTRLILWDIDKTLADGADLGREICGRAFQRLSGSFPTVEFVPDGSTDPAIIANLYQLHNLAHDGLSPGDVEQAYVAAFEAVVDRWRTDAQAMPGAHQAVAKLAADTGIVQSVLTGNVRGNAAGKLTELGLADHLDFDVGAYGSDSHHQRADLVLVAQRRAAAKYGASFDRSNTVLIGDTPRDVVAGLDGGASVIAVATGAYGCAELAAADVVLDSLEEVAAAVAELASGVS